MTGSVDFLLETVVSTVINPNAHVSLFVAGSNPATGKPSSLCATMSVPMPQALSKNRKLHYPKS